MGTNPKDLIGTKKPPLGLVPTAGIIHEAMAMKDGAKKYGPYNWRENGKAVRYTVYHNAALRHAHRIAVPIISAMPAPASASSLTPGSAGC